MFPTLAPDTAADAARTVLESAGWRVVGTGDWAWALASPDDTLAARITPFDPAFRLFADACLAGPPNPFLVRVDAVLPLRHRGYVVVMERLHPADEGRTHALVAALGFTGASDAPRADAPADLADHPDVVAFAASDRRPPRRRRPPLPLVGRRRRPAGQHPPDGGRAAAAHRPRLRPRPTIFESIRDGRADLLGDFSRTDLEDFLRIPAFEPGPATDALRRALDDLDIDGER